MLIFIISSVWRYENGVISEGGHEHGNIGHLLGTIRKDVSGNSLLLLFIEYGYLRAENILCGLLFSGNRLCLEYFSNLGVPDITFGGRNASSDGRCLIINGELTIFIGNDATEYVIPQNVTKINDGVFNNCSSLASITC